MSRLLVAVFLLGCVVPREAGFGDVRKLVAARTPERIHWNQGGPEDDKVDAWVRELLARDLTVQSATQIALLRNPTMQATWERLGVAQADVVQAGLLKNPSITGHVGVPLGSSAFEWEVSLFGSFLDLFLIPVKKRFAEAEFRRVKLDVAGEALRLCADVRASFYTVEAAQQIVEMRRLVLEAAQIAADLTVRQAEAGNRSELDLVTERRQLARTRLDLERAEAQLLAEREKLTRLLGVFGRETAWRISARLPDVLPDEPQLDHVESFAIEHRLDLAAARQESQTLGSALSVTKASRIIGGLDVGLAAHQDADGPRTIGPSLSIELPIFDQKQAAVARLRAQMRAAQRRVESLALQIRSEVRDARNRVVSARAVVDYYRTTVLPLSERSVALTQQEYNFNLRGTFELLLARRDEIEAYRDYIEVVRDYFIARSDLERAAGGRLPEIK
jgi:cobalt-zinc-cadmium efflux system outer membrane protein